VAEKRKEFQVTNDVAVVHPDPKLIKLVNAGAGRIEPDSARFGLAKLGPIGVGNEGKCQAKNRSAQFFSAEINPGRDAAPLLPPICSSHL